MFELTYGEVLQLIRTRAAVLSARPDETAPAAIRDDIQRLIEFREELFRINAKPF
jgi:hypothetical protein